MERANNKYMSAATAQQVYDFILHDKFYEDILKKFLSNKQQRNEFRQELWIYLCEMPENKIIEAWNRRYFKYLYIAIVKNQVASKTSRWHLKFRTPTIDGHRIELYEEFDFDSDTMKFDSFLTESTEDEIIRQEIKEEQNKKLKVINDSISVLTSKDSKFFVKSELFKMYYFDSLSYRDIEKKTNIPLVTVYTYVQEAQEAIKKHINKHYYN